MTELSPELEPIVIAALNQYVFCPRRCALMFVEGQWGDNEHTALGSLLHDHADEPGYETEGDVTLLRSLPLFSSRYGLSGKADIVEMRAGVPYPVEYKKGKRRKWENDDVQLCAQALCLEEMFNVSVPEGFIYHAASKRRRKVVFDARLRAETEATIEAVRVLLAERSVPSAVLMPRCEGCSLRDVCMPELTGANPPAGQRRYARELWQDT
ncbi:MAG TPA: CRISPR-associated protein Cas4 [Blastocatellia bacterium]|nr:CRISPR-associated protein Cas4 [Blastocatellia bacterium]